MKKKKNKEVKLLQIDPVTGEYYVIIPEWIINEFSWYEDTEILFNIDGNEIVLSENITND